MEHPPVSAQIAQLESIKKQAFWWRTGATVALAAIAVISVAGLNSAARGLTDAGPTQDVFVAQLSEGLRKETMPSIQTLASTTLTEMQPQIRAEFAKLNERVPELTRATMKELDTLRVNLPAAGEKVLNAEFDQLLTSREAKIRDMYPDATPEQVKTLVDNLRVDGHKELVTANTQLFQPHQAALENIMGHMETVRRSEAANTAGQNPDWEMGLAVLDIVRDDLRELSPKRPAKTDPKNAAAKTVAATTAPKGAK